MAQNKKKTSPKVENQIIDEQPKTATAISETISQNRSQGNFPGFKWQVIVLVVIGFVLYCNTFRHSYAFDDMIVIVQNEYVQEGLSGIPKILGGDAFESFTRLHNQEENQLNGGRYRPLSIVTFAIEQQFLGVNAFDQNKQDTRTFEERRQKLENDMHFRHVINVLLYIGSIIVLLFFLSNIVFPQSPMAAFFAALIFMVHPIHTEVVANVKSRDEILSFLFICLTFISAFRYRETHKIKQLILAMLSYLLALLSKEYGVLMIILLPLAFYMFNSYSLKKSLSASVVYIIPLVVYLAMRFSAVKPAGTSLDEDIMNYPYVLATGAEKLASELAVLMNYLKLLIFPHPLSSDYSYNQIPYSDFSSIKVWLSILVHSAMVCSMYFLVQKRHILGFAIAFYLAFLALVCNIFVNIGAPMGERLIYLSSLGFAIAVAFLLSWSYERIKPAMAGNVVIGGLLVVIVGLSGFKTIERNKDWESNKTLFLKDVQTVPNSVIVNANAGMGYLAMAGVRDIDSLKKVDYLVKAKNYFSKAILINPHFVVAYVNRCVCDAKLGDMDEALADCDSVRKYYPVHPSLPVIAKPVSDYFLTQGIKYNDSNMLAESIISFRKATEALPAEPDIWYDLAFSYCKNGQTKEGRDALNHALQLKPGHVPSLQLLQQLNTLGK